MILVMKNNISDAELGSVVQEIENAGLHTHISKGEEVTIVGLVGDKSKIDVTSLEANPSVEKVLQVTESYKLANKKFHPDPTGFAVKNTYIGPGTMTVRSVCSGIRRTTPHHR